MSQGVRGRSDAGDLVVALGSVVALAALLMPWWDGGGDRANGFHDWGWLTVAGLLGAVVLWAVRTLARETPRRLELSVDDGTAFVIAGSAEVLGAVVFWLANNVRLSGSVKYGVFVAVVAGAVTAMGGYLKHVTYNGSVQPPHDAYGSTPPSGATP